jgi:hypothetical protein
MGFGCNALPGGTEMTRQRALEIFEERRKIVAERILKNLAHSPAHAHLGALERMALADRQAYALMNTPPDEIEEVVEKIPGLTTDLFFIEET